LLSRPACSRVLVALPASDGQLGSRPLSCQTSATPGFVLQFLFMRIHSPLASLTDVLIQARESAHAYRGYLRGNEHVTRAVLIDPVLRSLGWDTANPFMVEVEKPIVDSRVDYALADSNGEIRAIIEAKKLGADLTDRRVYLSIIAYAFSAKVKDVFLTDGINWHHHSEFDPTNTQPPKVLDISGDSLIDTAAYFVNVLDAARYWPLQGDVDDLTQQVRQLESDLAELRNTVSLVSTKFPEHFLYSSDKPTSAGSADTASGFVPLDQIDDATRTKPSKLQLPDGSIVPLRSWNELLRESAKATLARNPSVTVPLKDIAGRKVQLLSKIRPPKGISYLQLEYRGEPLFLYTNYDANNCIANALHMLSYFPKEQGSLKPGALYASQ